MESYWVLENQITPPAFTGREVLFWYDGPRLQVFEVEGGLYVGIWADCNEDFSLDRWMFARAAEGVLESLTNGILPLRDVFTREPELIVADMTKEGTLATAWRVPIAKIPESVLAEPGARLERVEAPSSGV